ncbi:MAG: DNA polymerase III subunit delta' [Phascolarctobacterium sp.]|nr:DNA polymerase III subunit delta' [Phascolarctobacterium sp.]
MWDSVLGHEQNKEFLQNFLKAQARPHALLFCGAEGLGKKKLALEFAKSFLCLNGVGNDGCEACRLLNFADGNVSHPDFIMVERLPEKRELLIDQMRELIKQAAYAPVLSKNKICIIEDADTMREAAANSFLKLLEEPPDGWLIILLASSEDKLLTTILSRVVKLRFNPLAVADVKQLLVERGIADQESEVLARISEGSVGAALNLHQQQALEYRQTAISFLEALPLEMPLNYLAGRTWVEKYERSEAILFVKLLQLLLRDMLFVKIGMTANLYNCDLQEILTALCGGWQPQGLKKALAAVSDAYKALNTTTGVKLILENLAMKIDNFRKE